MSTTRKTPAIDISEAVWQVCPQDQGQMVEIAYAEVEGGVVRRAVDRSKARASERATYEFLSWDDGHGKHEPWNGEMLNGPWRMCEVRS